MSSQQLRVHAVGAGFGLPSASPFVVKLLTWLRMAEIPYQRVDLLRPPASKTGKVPYVELPDGTIVEDSQHIIETLAAQHDIDPWAGLDEGQRALAHHLQNTVEGSLYWALLWERWCSPGGLEPYVDVFFGAVPGLLRGVVAGAVQRKTRKQAWQQGIARRPPEQIAELGRRDLAALATTLGSDPWFLGRPTVVDASAYGLLAQLDAAPLDTALTRAYREQAVLVDFVARVRDRWWSDS